MFTIPWISVKDSLPPAEMYPSQSECTESALVWAWGDITSFGDQMFLAKYDHLEGVWWDDNGNLLLPPDSVTYWHPIPEPPEGCDWGLYPSQVKDKKVKG